TSESFTYQTSQAIALTFNRDVGNSISSTDLVIENLDTQQIVPSSSISLVFSSLTGTFTVAGSLPGGNYRAILPANSVHDSAGLTLGDDDVTFDFFVLLGDTNHDRTVNVVDLGNLASNFGLSSGATWGQGDFNYDGNVNVADLGDLATNFGVTLAAAGSSSQ